MFIAINGQLGSGKSELCKRLKDEYGFEVFHTGRIQREFAAELGISTLQLNELCKQDHHYDRIIDSRLVEYAESVRGTDVVFDSRMAWHFVKGAFKVHLLVSPDIAADRVYFNRVAEEEKYASKEEAMFNLIERRRLENERYEMLYKVEMSDYRNYDLILDTSLLTVKEELDLIVGAARRYEAKRFPAQEFYSSLLGIYPTESLFKSPDGEAEVVKKGDFLYAVSGYRKLLDAAHRGLRVVNVKYAGVSDSVKTDAALISEWESAAEFKYGFVPEN